MELKNINKYYHMKNSDLHVLKDVNVKFEKNHFYAIMGRSGSGKSTLVNILGLLDGYSSGEYLFEDLDVKKLTNEEKSNIRGMKIGFVFQSFYLNNNLTAIENVMLPLYINNKVKKGERISSAKKVLADLGLENRINHYPSELSGGEQQRVAIARALINDPEIIIADEPTGNLDSKSEKEVFEILKQISKKDKIVIVVSHNELIKEYCDFLYVIDDGIVKRGNL